MMNTFKRAAALLTALCIVITLCSCGSRKSENALERVIDSGTVVFGVAPYNSPISWFDRDGTAHGLAVDVGAMLASRLNAEPVFVSVRESEALPAINGDEIDCYLYLPDPGVKLSAQILSVDALIDCRQVAVISSFSKASRLVDLRTWKVGVRKNTRAERVLSEATELTGSFMSLEKAYGTETLLGMLSDKEIGAVIMDECEYLYYTKGDRERYKIMEEPLDASDYLIVMQHSDENLYSMIEYSMSAMKSDGSFDGIRSEWLD